jgi:DNA-directed RNA polymerase subunit M/transcription elongation factor TFIIS
MEQKPITVVHVIGPLGKPECPKCGSKHEDDGGEVSRRGSMDEGPFYWQCDKCGEQWGHA